MRWAWKSIAPRDRIDDLLAESWDVTTQIDNFDALIASHASGLLAKN